MKKIIKIIPFLFLFVFIVIFNLVFIPNNLDEIWNYGFSYAIRLGEVPYKDFNIILTPFHSFFMTIPLLINNSYLSYIIFYSFIMTLEFYLIKKIINKKVYIILLISLIFFSLIYPTYNSFFLFLMILVCYLENNDFKYKDYILGFLISCCILTKQSVGIFFIIPSLLFYKKNNISLIKRLIGFLVPNLIFLIYLLITNSLFDFFNLCLFGLFDFVSNSQGFGISFVVFIVITFISIYILIKNRSNIINYYIIISYLLYIPLFDNLHLFYVLFCFCLLILINIKDLKINYELLFYPCFIILILVYGKGFNALNYKINNIKHFEYKNISTEKIKYTNTIVDYISNNDSIIFNDDAYYYRICANQKIGYLDLLNHGNYGYNGSKKIIELINSNKDKKYLISKDLKKRLDNKSTQIDYKGYLYIIKHAKKVGEIEDFYIYSFNYE